MKRGRAYLFRCSLTSWIAFDFCSSEACAERICAVWSWSVRACFLSIFHDQPCVTKEIACWTQETRGRDARQHQATKTPVLVARLPGIAILGMIHSLQLRLLRQLYEILRPIFLRYQRSPGTRRCLSLALTLALHTIPRTLPLTLLRHPHIPLPRNLRSTRRCIMHILRLNLLDLLNWLS